MRWNRRSRAEAGEWSPSSMGLRTGRVLHRVGVEAFRHAFSHAAEGTEAENAALDLVIMPVRAVCRTCQAETEGDDVIMVCPKCNGIDLDLTGGDELVLESIEYEGQATTSWLGKE